jgi:hypothetical protein
MIQKEWHETASGFEITEDFRFKREDKYLNFVKTFTIGEIPLSLFKNKHNFYLGYWKDKELFMCYEVSRARGTHLKNLRTLANKLNKLGEQNIKNQLEQYFEPEDNNQQGE